VSSVKQFYGSFPTIVQKMSRKFQGLATLVFTYQAPYVQIKGLAIATTIRQMHTADTVPLILSVAPCTAHYEPPGSTFLYSQRWGFVRSAKRCRHCILG
jgi:hypothetical protein